MFYWDLNHSAGTGSIGAQTAIGFMPDSTTLVTASEDEQLRFWDVNSLRVKSMVQLKHDESPLAYFTLGTPAGVAADGGSFLSIDRGQLRMWDTKTGSLKWSSQSQADAAVFAENSKTVATYGRAGHIDFWDVQTGKRQFDPIQVNAIINSAALSRDLRMVATAGETQGVTRGTTYISGRSDVRIFSLETGRQLRKLTSLDGPASAIAFTPDGKSIALCSTFNGVTLWSVATGKKLASLRGPVRGRHGGTFTGDIGVHDFAFSPDGSILAGAAHRSVYLWDIKTRRYMRHTKLINTPNTIGDFDVGEVRFSPDGSLLAISEFNGRSVTLERTDLSS